MDTKIHTANTKTYSELTAELIKFFTPLYGDYLLIQSIRSEIQKRKEFIEKTQNKIPQVKQYLDQQIKNIQEKIVKESNLETKITYSFPQIQNDTFDKYFGAGVIIMTKYVGYALLYHTIINKLI